MITHESSTLTGPMGQEDMVGPGRVGRQVPETFRSDLGVNRRHCPLSQSQSTTRGRQPFQGLRVPRPENLYPPLKEGRKIFMSPPL